MIEITDKTQCCGCTACAEACPVQCIKMHSDVEGFDYPVADHDVCIGCGRCWSVCPMKDERPASEPLATYAARSPGYMEKSSSGGIFPVLAENTVNDGGVVAGAAFDDSLSLKHVLADESGALNRLFGSKYVQSRMNGIYSQVRTILDSGRKVLFSGTPCQVSGLKGYLGSEYENLLTVDVACHGVPSPLLWRLYSEALSSQNQSGALLSVNFRDKSESWRNYNVEYRLQDKVLKVRNTDDPYMLLFLQNMSLRPSCYSCKFRSGRGCSDLTLGDLWNVKEVAGSLDDDRGVSVVVVRTDKGRQAFEAAKDSDVSMCAREVEYGNATSCNGGFVADIVVPEGRADLFTGLADAEDVLKYINRFILTESWPVKMYKRLHSALARLKRRLI